MTRRQFLQVIAGFLVALFGVANFVASLRHGNTPRAATASTVPANRFGAGKFGI